MSRKILSGFHSNIFESLKRVEGSTMKHDFALSEIFVETSGDFKCIFVSFCLACSWHFHFFAERRTDFKCHRGREGEREEKERMAESFSRAKLQSVERGRKKSGRTGEPISRVFSYFLSLFFLATTQRKSSFKQMCV